MTGLGTTSSLGNDWSRVRWNRLRWDLVNVLELSSHHPDDVPMAGCNELECCFGLRELVDDLGLRLDERKDRWSRLEFVERFEDFETTDMRDALMMLSDFYGGRLMSVANPFDGMLEIPKVVGAIYHADHFRELRTIDSEAEADLDLVREFVYALTTIALPDSFLQRVWTGNGDDERGEPVYRRFRRMFEDDGLIAPTLSKEVINELRSDSLGYGTPFFPATWDWLGLYSLDMGREDGSSSLEDYWLELPTIRWAFGYTDRSNGYGLAMCFMARRHGSILVSQQTWMSLIDSGPNAADEWNRCTTAFNKHIAPLLEYNSSGASAMVVYSGYRNHAYIVSSDERSWDDYAPMRAVLGPLPGGWGIVGVWDGLDTSRYKPRPLEEIVKANYSEAITAAANYLRDCLTSTNR